MYNVHISFNVLILNFLREISWKEFVTQHLSRGTVEKLEVINHKWVKVNKCQKKGSYVVTRQGFLWRAHILRFPTLI